MIQFFVQKILEKTKRVIEQFDDDRLVQNMALGLAMTSVEESAFLQRYFPDATEELFRGKAEMKKRYLTALRAWFDEKRRLGGGGETGAAFARRLLLPTHADEKSPFSYSRQSELEWNRFAVAFASEIKGPTAIVIKTKQKTNEVVSHADLNDPQFDEIADGTDDGKVAIVQFEADSSGKVEFKTKTEIEEEMKLKFQAKVKMELEQAGLFVEHIEIRQEFGTWKAVGRTRDRFGKVASFETADQPFEDSREYQFTDAEKPNISATIGIFELPAARDGIALLFERQVPGMRAAASARPSAVSARGTPTGGDIEAKMAGMQAAMEKFGQKKKYQSGASRQTPRFSGMPSRPSAGAPTQPFPKKKSNFVKIFASGIGGAAAFFGATFGGGFFFS